MPRESSCSTAKNTSNRRTFFASTASAWSRASPQNLEDESQGRQPSETAPKAEDEATFAKQLTETLNRMVLQHKVEELAVIADPNTLGVMRKHYHKELENRLKKELAKTLTAATAQEVAKALA